MPYGMYLSAEGAKAQAQRLEFIANNLANVDTPGFKRDVPTFQARFAEAIPTSTRCPSLISTSPIRVVSRHWRITKRTGGSRRRLSSTAAGNDRGESGSFRNR